MVKETNMATMSIALSLRSFLSLISLFKRQNLSNLALASSGSGFRRAPFSMASCKITKLSLPVTCLPSVSSIVRLASLTCTAPPAFPQHVTLITHWTVSMVTANKTSRSPVSQCRRAATGRRLETFAARFRVGSMTIQLIPRFSSRWASHEDSSSHFANIKGVGTTSLGSRRSTQSGEERNHPLWVSVVMTREKTGLPL